MEVDRVDYRVVMELSTQATVDLMQKMRTTERETGDRLMKQALLGNADFCALDGSDDLLKAAARLGLLIVIGSLIRASIGAAVGPQTPTEEKDA